MRSFMLAVGTLAASVASAQYQTIDFSSQFNFNRTDGLLANGTSFPTGNQTFLTVPFQMGSGAGNTDPWGWTAYRAVTGGPAKLTIPTSIFGVTDAYSIINTFWGQAGPNSYASITFNATNGVSHTVQLVGNSDIRDYNQYTWTNTINDTTTKEVFSNGAGQRLDMQSYALPGAFASETLTSIVLDDTGANNFQRILVAGLTVKTIPAPGLAGMGLIGAVTLAGRRRR
jgi:hypothetical protein